MMSKLDELRALQSSQQKKSILLFVLWNAILFTVTAGTFFFTNYFNEYPSFKLLPLAFFLLGIPLTKIYLFFRPKEFCATVVWINVVVELRKKYLSGQAGVSLSAKQVKMMELIVENERGKTIWFSIPYRRDYEKLRVGDRVVILRFVNEILMA